MPNDNDQPNVDKATVRVFNPVTGQYEKPTAAQKFLVEEHVAQVEGKAPPQSDAPNPIPAPVATPAFPEAAEAEAEARGAADDAAETRRKGR